MIYRAIISVPIEATENEDALTQAQAYADAILNESEEIIGQLELVYEVDNGQIIQRNAGFLNGMGISTSRLKPPSDEP
jgi:hypothetical protein